jgi:3-oxoacyl-[acyl-carrier protein] reductase
MKILITGTSSDISQSLLTYLTKEGHEVKTTSRSGNGDSLQFDFHRFNENQLQAIQYFSPDVVIFNAMERLEEQKRIHHLDLEKSSHYISSCLKGHLALTQALLPEMKSQKFGRFILISSLSALYPTSRYAPYCMAKAALESLIRSIALEYGGFNILANGLRLGTFQTERTREHWENERYYQKLTSIIPQRQMGKPKDINSLINAMMANNTFLNGEMINITGGLPMLRPEGLL